MSTVRHVALTPRSFRSRAWFWIKRYGPAEIGCLITMLIASALAATVTDSPPLLAVAAIAGATVGFYGVLITTVVREQLRIVPTGTRARIPRLALRAALLLLAEFGVAEVLDTFFLRPLLMMAGVIVIGSPVWGLLAGKLIADVLFYVISAVCFRLTERTGARTRTHADASGVDADASTRHAHARALNMDASAPFGDEAYERRPLLRAA